MKLIWCQGGNKRSAGLAVAAGWGYGFRSDDKHFADELGPVALLDCHWEQPDWQRHLDVAATVKPMLATVPDVLSLDQLPDTLRQAKLLAPLCSALLIVPKCADLIPLLPREIDGKLVVLGYSIPTGYGGTPLPLWEFKGWPTHLLGGSARDQLDLCGYLNVISCDGNVAWRLARRGIIVTEHGIGGPSILEADGQRWPAEDAHLECLRRSLVNLKKFWNRHRKIEWRTDAAQHVDTLCGRP